jgi:hypothetical protein
MLYVPLKRTGTWSDIIKSFAALGVGHRQILGRVRLLSSTIPLFTEPGKGGYIFLRKKKGISVLKAQMSIGSSRIKILQEVRNLGIKPAHTAEFYDQLFIAFTKWQTKHCAHCSGPIHVSDPCPSCGYRGEQDRVLAVTTQTENTQVRPVQNSILDILEFIMNPLFVVGAAYISPLFILTKWTFLFFLWGLLGLIALSFPMGILYFKRKSEKNLIIEISEKFITYSGESLYMKGVTIPLQDIISVSRYANHWQRLFGLGNLELETRNALPYTKSGPIFHSVIPSIRNAEEIEQLLRKKCDFLKQ